MSSTLTADAELDLPSLKKSPLAPNAVVATPNKRATIMARPTTNTVALPTHITLLTMLPTMCLLLWRRSGNGSVHALSR